LRWARYTWCLDFEENGENIKLDLNWY
jgi:hypothetical protein